METQKNDISKQVYLIFGLVLFAFINVFLFDSKTGIGFSVFSTLTLLTIGMLSKRQELRVLAVISYLINVLVAWRGFNYIGWLTAVQAIELVFVVWFLYPKDTFLKKDETDRPTFNYRLGRLAKVVGITAGVYLLYRIASSLWDGTFLEYGGNAALIFAIQYLLYVLLAKIHLEEDGVIAHRTAIAKSIADMRLANQDKVEQGLKRSRYLSIEKNSFVKLASIWLIVMDLSILSYIIRPNDFGFGVGAFFVLLSIIVSLLVKTEEDTTDVFSVIYYKLRPVQPVFFIILLIAHAHKFSYGAAYALVFAAAYFVWAIGKINMKTLLTATILIYFFPVLGYISNPFRLGATSLSEVGKLIVKTGDPDYFNLINWLDFSSDSLGEKSEMFSEDEEIDDAWESDTADKEAPDFSEEALKEKTRLYIDYFSLFSSNRSGIITDDYYPELEFNYNSVIDEVEVNVRTTKTLLSLSGYQEAYERAVKNPSGEEFPYQYRGYVYLQDIEGAYGTYRIYLQMDESWLEDFKNNPDDVVFDFIISGVDGDLSKVDIY